MSQPLAPLVLRFALRSLAREEGKKRFGGRRRRTHDGKLSEAERSTAGWGGRGKRPFSDRTAFSDALGDLI